MLLAELLGQGQEELGVLLADFVFLAQALSFTKPPP
jgi:hypothetical protein